MDDFNPDVSHETEDENQPSKVWSEHHFLTFRERIAERDRLATQQPEEFMI